MKAAMALALLLFSMPLTCAFALKESRDEMLTHYYASIESKIPKTARMLMGDERVNIYIGGKTIGLETRGGDLYSFEFFPIEKPSIEITVSDNAADRISRGEMGITQAIDTGGIRIRANNLLAAFKVEMMRRVYAASGADEQILGKKKPSGEGYGSSASLYLQKVKIQG